MRLILAALAALLVAGPVEALPVINATSGPLTHGQTLTITGTGFGTKPVAAPLKYDDFEGGTYGALVGNGWSLDCAGPGADCRPDYSSRQLRTNSTMSARARFWGSGANEVWESSIWLTVTPPALDHVYLDYWVNVTAVPASPVFPDNQKLFRIHTPSGDPNLYFNIYCDDGVLSHLSQDHTYLDGTDATGHFHRYFNSTPPNYRNNWKHIQGYFEKSSPVTSPPPVGYDGTARFWVDSRNYVDDRDWNNTTTTASDWNRIFFGNFSQPPGSGHSCGYRDTAYIYMDNVYVDTTQAHVEIGDGTTYNTCTVREIQPPTSWIDTAINVTLNRGAWADFTGKYAYVVDRSGNVSNAGAGFALTGNPAPPSSCASGASVANHIVHVQTPTAFVAGNVSTGAKAFASDVTSGNTLIVAEVNGRSGGPYSISSIAKTAGTATIGSFTAAGSGQTSTTRKCEIWTAPITGSGSLTLTVTMSGSTDLSFSESEFTGIASTPLDGTSGAAATSTTASCLVTTTNPNNVLIGIMGQGESSTPLTSGSGFTMLAESEASTFMPMHSEYRVITSAGNKTVDVGLDASKQWFIYGAAFKSTP